jgi:hypothetical protein
VTRKCIPASPERAAIGVSQNAGSTTPGFWPARPRANDDAAAKLRQLDLEDAFALTLLLAARILRYGRAAVRWHFLAGVTRARLRTSALPHGLADIWLNQAGSDVGG